MGKTNNDNLINLINRGKAGTMKAQRDLGFHYLSKNKYKIAVKWFTEAAEQGDAAAQTMLGVCCLIGKGIEKDSKRAVEWFDKAAKQNDPVAQIMLGFCYYYGEGVQQDYQLAIKWFDIAKKHNSTIAQVLAVDNYYNGIKVENNLNEAIKWLIETLEQGDGFNFGFLKHHYIFQRDGEVAVPKKIKKRGEIVAIKKNEPKKKRKISSLDSLTKLLEENCKDITALEKYDISYDPKLLIIKIKIKGTKYDSTITTSVMRYILSIQKGIYKTYKLYNNGKLTNADKKRLELTVKVEKGSSDISVSLFDIVEIIKTAVANMTGSQILAGVIIGIVTWGTVSITKKILDGKEKKLEIEAGNNRLKILAEAIAKGNEEASKDKQKTLEYMIETFKVVEGMKKDALQELKEIGEENSLLINDVTLTHESIAERSKREKVVYQEETGTITGNYRITKMTINFKEKSASMDIFEIETGDPLFGVMVQPKSIYDGSYKVLNKAKNNSDIELQLIVTKKNENIVKVILDKIL